MSKLKYFIIALVVMVGIVAILISNKSKMEAKSKVATKLVHYVSVVKAEKSEIKQDLSLIGTFSAVRDIMVLSETQGRVTKVNMAVGEYKSAGSVLAEVDDELKRAAYKSAEANYEKTKKDYERFQKLFEQNSATEAQLENAKFTYVNAESQYIVAKKQLADTKITTPVSGTVTMKNIEVGTMLMNNGVVANIIDISGLKLKVNVAENEVVKIKKGDRAKVYSDVYPGVEYTGVVESVSDKGDESHTYAVEIKVQNNNSARLKAGMFGRVVFDNISSGEYLTIPRSAVLGSVRDAYVYIAENGKVKKRFIVIGNDTGTTVSVISGLKEGETVVTAGQNTLEDDVTVEIVN
ncbi:MAG: efflux RND transporter periplasmic adaptor subunit [Ignavibacteriaceae bacterium]|nr:efflux RND transporter periplasmic adaptor subunit [Ignavibacteriaceae bacterium]